jgi:hypothetical protein
MTSDAELWTWERVSDVPPESFDDARLVVHWAVQIVAAVGATLLPPRPDASHTALTWVRTTRAFASEPLASGARAGLIVEGLRLIVLRADGTIAESFSLSEQSIEDALGWLRLALDRVSKDPVARLVRPDHPLPAHPVGTGSLFPAGDQPGYQELARWYGNATEILTAIANEPGASPVRCWPHHFDLATLLSLDSNTHSDPENARSIGVGFSPGDVSPEESDREPYWYVNPWPSPKADGLPKLEVGQWHTDGWVGAQLKASAMTTDRQAHTVRTFLEGAIAKGRELLAPNHRS